jgi:signal peptidase
MTAVPKAAAASPAEGAETSASLVLRAARWVVTAGCWAGIGLVSGLALAVSLPAVLGFQTLTVLSGSMEPTLHVGAVVIDERITPREAKVGDVITFPAPGNRNRLITHRLRSVRVSGGKAYMVTKGDANDTVERWNVPVRDEIGRVRYQLPKLGYVRDWLGGRDARLWVLIAIVVVGLWALVDLWRPRKSEASGRRAD